MDFSRRLLMSAAPALIAGTAGAAAPALAASSQAFLSAADFGVRPGATGDQSASLRKAIAKAAERQLTLLVPGGEYEISDLRIDLPVAIQGVRGLTRLKASGGRGIFSIDAPTVTLDGLSFEGASDPAERQQALVSASNCAHLAIAHCGFRYFVGNGLLLTQCSGQITQNIVAAIGQTGIFALDSKGLEITGNHLQDIGNNAIQVWTSDQRTDGTLVSGNRIERVRVDGGGTGQNGNGIVVFRAGNVIVGNNRISDCGYSAVRNNSGRNCQIVNNSCSRLGETALYSEFAFDGAVISGNLVEEAATGVSITNFDQGGRLAVCATNVIRKIFSRGSDPRNQGLGIGAEADTIVTGNVVEDVDGVGISAGWGPMTRNLMVSGNLLRQCAVAITASASQGAGPMSIVNNLIAQSKQAIIGMNYLDPVTGDLALKETAVPAHLTITGNTVS